MTTEVVPYRQATLADRKDYAATLANAGDLLPRALWSPVRKPDGTMGPPEPSPGKILLVLETAAMLGLDPMAGLQGIYVIEGKATLSAALMSAVVRAKGFTLRVETSGKVADGTFKATATLIRPDDPEHPYVATWDAERVKRAGLDNKDVWKKYFEAMSKARAISEVCREGAEDVLLGVHYTPEELADAGELVPAENAPVVETATDWKALVAAAETADAVLAIWGDVPDAERTDELHSIILRRGGELRRAEAQAPAAPEDSTPPTADAPADSDVIDAEVVDDPVDDESAPPTEDADEYARIEAAEYAKWQAEHGA